MKRKPMTSDDLVEGLHESPNFDTWMDEVVRFAKDELGWSKKALASIRNSEGWDEYFKEGLTPKEAWSQEYSYGQ